MFVNNSYQCDTQLAGLEHEHQLYNKIESTNHNVTAIDPCTPEMMNSLSSSTYYSTASNKTQPPSTSYMMNNSSTSILSLLSSASSDTNSIANINNTIDYSLTSPIIEQPAVEQPNKFDSCKESVSAVFNALSACIEQRKQLLLQQISQIEAKEQKSTSVVDKIEFKYDTNAFNTLSASILPNIGLVRFCEFETKHTPSLLSLYNNSCDLNIKVNWKIVDIFNDDGRDNNSFQFAQKKQKKRKVCLFVRCTFLYQQVCFFAFKKRFSSSTNIIFFCIHSQQF